MKKGALLSMVLCMSFVLASAVPLLAAPRYFYQSLGTLPGGNGSNPFGINQSGQATGWSLNDSGLSRAFLKNFGQPMQDLGTLGGNESSGYAINNAGQVVGEAQNASDNWHAFLQTPGQPMEDLGTLGGDESFATGINQTAQIVGGAFNADGFLRAFLKPAGQPLADLGTLGGSESSANAINSSGQIVGWAVVDAEQTLHAFLYDKGVMYDLNTLTLNLPAGITLIEAIAINDRGWIVGADSSGQAFLLTPAVTAITGPLQLLLLY